MTEVKYLFMRCYPYIFRLCDWRELYESIRKLTDLGILDKISAYIFLQQLEKCCISPVSGKNISFRLSKN